MVGYDLIQYGTVWYGIRYGMAWHGMAWHCMMQYDTIHTGIALTVFQRKCFSPPPPETHGSSSYLHLFSNLVLPDFSTAMPYIFKGT